MSIPNGFAFSQSSLQDFVDCPRRFELRYILKLSWPAIQTEPVQEVERSMQMGERFHHLAHQRMLGVPYETLQRQVRSSGLETWWANLDDFLENTDEFPVGTASYPEITLQASMDDVRLIAKFDLVLVKPDGNLTILDWKTSQKQPRRQWLQKRLQTRLYPYLLVNGGMHLVGNRMINPSQVKMVYWYAVEPDQPISFAYDERMYAEDATYLSKLIGKIKRQDQEGYPLTSDERLCQYCVYRSLCDRGVQAGEMEGLQDDLSETSLDRMQIDFEHITEIDY